MSIRRSRPVRIEEGPEERADTIGFDQRQSVIARERNYDLMQIHGKTERELELEADALLRAAGFEMMEEV